MTDPVRRAAEEFIKVMPPNEDVANWKDVLITSIRNAYAAKVEGRMSDRNFDAHMSSEWDGVSKWILDECNRARASELALAADNAAKDARIAEVEQELATGCEAAFRQGQSSVCAMLDVKDERIATLESELAALRTQLANSDALKEMALERVALLQDELNAPQTTSTTSNEIGIVMANEAARQGLGVKQRLTVEETADIFGVQPIGKVEGTPPFIRVVPVERTPPMTPDELAQECAERAVATLTSYGLTNFDFESEHIKAASFIKSTFTPLLARLEAAERERDEARSKAQWWEENYPAAKESMLGERDAALQRATEAEAKLAAQERELTALRNYERHSRAWESAETEADAVGAMRAKYKAQDDLDELRISIRRAAQDSRDA